MSVLVAVSGALIVAGVVGVIAGLRPRPVTATSAAAPRGRLFTSSSARRLSHGLRDAQTRRLGGAGLAAGLVLALVFGWWVAVIVLPVAAVKLPARLSQPEAGRQIERLEGMEEWTRSLSSLLTSGAGLEAALLATLRSTPDAIRPEVERLTARLRARWPVERVLRAFADDLDDATGDLIAGDLLLASRRRGAGVAQVLEALAESVAADVRARREIEADRAKPRSTARFVTLCTLACMVLLAFSGDYIAPYRTAVGQLVLLVLLGAYGAALVWMRHMARFMPLPRFLGATSAAAVPASAPANEPAGSRVAAAGGLAMVAGPDAVPAGAGLEAGVDGGGSRQPRERGRR